MSRELVELFNRREQSERLDAELSTSPMLRDVHLRMADHYRRLTNKVAEATWPAAARGPADK